MNPDFSQYSKADITNLEKMYKTMVESMEESKKKWAGEELRDGERLTTLFDVQGYLDMTIDDLLDAYTMYKELYETFGDFEYKQEMKVIKLHLAHKKGNVL
jgi:hypothetical protein